MLFYFHFMWEKGTDFTDVGHRPDSWERARPKTYRSSVDIM